DPAGADNLVVGSNVMAPPPGVITVTTDPMLGPLQLNGGTMPTHVLLPGSPAIGTGNNVEGWGYDQRGSGYPRTSGPNAKVDMGALQFDTIFVGTFD
ncbi:MAG TPA: choice-of-anchor Q domain-containing protein, partial [Rhodanobacteraceae bacterium]